MLNTAEIRNAYNDLYVAIRKYFWGFEAVEDLAELEIACYKAFPDKSEIKRSLAKIRRHCLPILRDDEDLKKALENLESLVDSDEEMFSKLVRS